MYCSDSSILCAAHPCSLCWPQLESVGAECNMDENFIYENITLRNITINDPQFSYGQGIVLGNPVTPMKVSQDVTEVYRMTLICKVEDLLSVFYSLF